MRIMQAAAPGFHTMREPGTLLLCAADAALFPLAASVVTGAQPSQFQFSSRGSTNASMTTCSPFLSDISSASL